MHGFLLYPYNFLSELNILNIFYPWHIHFTFAHLLKINCFSIKQPATAGVQCAFSSILANWWRFGSSYEAGMVYGIGNVGMNKKTPFKPTGKWIFTQKQHSWEGVSQQPLSEGQGVKESTVRKSKPYRRQIDRKKSETLSDCSGFIVMLFLEVWF